MYNKKKFERVCNGYIDRLAYAKFLCSIYSSKPSVNESNKMMETAPHFFDASFKAIKHQALLTSANFFLFGQSNEFTIHKLLKILTSDSNIRRGSNTEALDVAIERIRDYLNGREELIKRLIEWRNRYIAHNDKKYFNDRDGIDSEEIEISELLDLLAGCIEQITILGKIIDIEIVDDHGKYVNDFPKL